MIAKITVAQPIKTKLNVKPTTSKKVFKLKHNHQTWNGTDNKLEKLGLSTFILVFTCFLKITIVYIGTTKPSISYLLSLKARFKRIYFSILNFLVFFSYFSLGLKGFLLIDVYFFDNLS